MEDTNTPDKASFNQAQYQQVRLNELLLRMDRRWTNPQFYDSNAHEYNYIIIANDLFSLFVTISSKLTKQEIEEMIKAKDEITELISTTPFVKQCSRGQLFSPGNLKTINDKMFLFRMKLERLMDIHGFGNPTKDDPRKSVFKGI